MPGSRLVLLVVDEALHEVGEGGGEQEGEAHALEDHEAGPEVDGVGEGVSGRAAHPAASLSQLLLQLNNKNRLCSKTCGIDNIL